MMKPRGEQLSIFDPQPIGFTPVKKPSEADLKDMAPHALDEIFTIAGRYKNSKEFYDLLKCISKFRMYSPFNAMLINLQMPGARFVATAKRWDSEYKRQLKSTARPLVILQPMGPVMFVYDVSETEATEHSKPLPDEIANPFRVRSGQLGSRLMRLIENAKRDGIRYVETPMGSQSAGSIRTVALNPKNTLSFVDKKDKKGNEVIVNVAVRYELHVNANMDELTRYATALHELAHLYCGHLGSHNPKAWPDRRGLPHRVKELEAESVSYIVCTRAGLVTPSERYLADYVEMKEDVEGISPDTIIKAGTLIEQMSTRKLRARKGKAK